MFYLWNNNNLSNTHNGDLSGVAGECPAEA